MQFDFEWMMTNIRAGTYELLGEGSGRKVYDLNNGYVVKLAKNRRGFAQSKAEKIIYDNSRSPLIAEIVGCSESHELLIMVKAEKINSMSVVCEHFNIRSRKQIRGVGVIRDFCKENSIELGDFIRKQNWGLIDGKPVIIDYGFTKQIRRKYY